MMGQLAPRRRGIETIASRRAFDRTLNRRNRRSDWRSNAHHGWRGIRGYPRTVPAASSAAVSPAQIRHTTACKKWDALYLTPLNVMSHACYALIPPSPGQKNAQLRHGAGEETARVASGAD